MSMHPDSVIVCKYRRSYGISKIPYNQNILTCQSADTNNATRDPWTAPLHLPLSSAGYRIFLPIPLMPGIYRRPSPLFCRHSSPTPPGPIVLSVYQSRSGSTMGWWKLPSCHLRITLLLAPSSVPPSAAVRCRSSWLSFLPAVTICRRCCRPVCRPQPLPSSCILSGGPLRPPPE